MDARFGLRGCLISATIIATVVVVASGLICQFPHCETVDCDPVPDNCTGEIRLGGGYCGCCIACITYVGNGEECEYKDGVDERLYPATVLCTNGLYCERNSSTCEPLPGFGFG